MVNGNDYQGGSIRTGVGALVRYIKRMANINVELRGTLFQILDKKLKDLAVVGNDEGKEHIVFTRDQERQLLASFDESTPEGLTAKV